MQSSSSCAFIGLGDIFTGLNLRDPHETENHKFDTCWWRHYDVIVSHPRRNAPTCKSLYYWEWIPTMNQGEIKSVNYHKKKTI